MGKNLRNQQDDSGGFPFQPYSARRWSQSNTGEYSGCSSNRTKRNFCASGIEERSSRDEQERSDGGSVPVIDAFNEGDAKVMATTFTVPGSILDGMAPHVWQGPTATQDWYVG
jgi:hypothetical protein